MTEIEMNLSRKLVAMNVLGLTVLAVAFFSVMYFIYLPRTEQLYYTSLTERYSDDAQDILLILHLATSGDGRGVEDSLNLKLDNYVHELNTLLQTERETKAIASARAVLRKIALHREAFPRQAANILQSDVDGILSQVRN